MESYDRCVRQWAYLYGEGWELGRVKPLEAVYGALHAVLEAKEYAGPQMARQWVMDVAGERGVWTERDNPYDMIVNHAHIAEVMARAVRQPSDPPLEKYGMCPVKGYHEWRPDSYLINGGTRLMRLVLVDHWDDDRALAECHSWRTMGDVCVTGLPMNLRVLVMGQMRAGKRHGHWGKARMHPTMRALRFARRRKGNNKPEGFQESWETVWREDVNVGADKWLEQMARDRVLSEVAFNVPVRVPGEYARQRVLEDIERIGDEMSRNAGRDGSEFPMNRSACDSPIYGPCPLQCVCFAPTEISVAETGVFRRRGGSK
jgi:hypothetical protein